MPDYSNQPLNEGDISQSTYSDEGYIEESIDPEESAEKLAKSGINEVRNKVVYDRINKDQTATSRDAKRKKKLKLLFLQYIRKYLSNPKKYKEHPKQIKNLPSWFDDAIVLFSDGELNRDQKKYLREYFYGLIQYRDKQLMEQKLHGESPINYQGPNIEESNRQLGMRSPYVMNEENIDDVSFPKEREMSQIDAMKIARGVVSQKLPLQEQNMDEIMDVEVEKPYVFDVRKEKPYNNMGVRNIQKNPSGGLSDYILPIGGRKQPQAPVSNPLPPTPSNPAIPKRSVGTGSLTNFINGGAGIQLRRHGNTAPKINRIVTHQPKKVVTKRGGIGLSIDLPKIYPKPIDIGSISMNKKKSKSGFSIDIPSINKKAKSKSGFAIDIPSMNIHNHKKVKKVKTRVKPDTKGLTKLFNQVKSESVKNFGKQNMKMDVLNNIKDQCGKALSRNNFKRESVNMKNNYFDDVKSNAPKVKINKSSMGSKIRESDMMRGIENVLSTMSSQEKSIPTFKIKPGSMQPKAVGRPNYDFTLGDEVLRSKIERNYKKRNEIDDDYMTSGTEVEFV